MSFKNIETVLLAVIPIVYTLYRQWQQNDKNYKEQQEAREAKKIETINSYRSMLFNLYNNFKTTGTIDEDELYLFNQIFTSYKELGANGQVENWHQKINNNKGGETNAN